MGVYELTRSVGGQRSRPPLARLRARTRQQDKTGRCRGLKRPAIKSAAAQETPEGHAVRLDAQGHITHITAINARWWLNRGGELIATLRDGRSLRLTPADVANVMH